MEKRPKISRQSIRDASRHLKPAIGLVWRADHKAFLTLLLITLVSSILPVGHTLMGRWIIDSVLAAANSDLSVRDGIKIVSPYVAAELALMLMGMALVQYRRYATEVLNQKLSYSVSSQIMEKAAQLDIHYFEDAAFLDKLQSARQETKYRAMGLISEGFFLIQNSLTLISFVTPIIIFNPWIALILFGSTLPAFVAQTYYSRMTFRLHSWHMPEGRKMTYYEHLLTSDSAAKEIRVFQLARSLMSRHSDLFRQVFKEDQKLAFRKSFASVLWGALSSLSFYACYAWIIFKTIARALSLGQMTFYLASFRQLQGTFVGLFQNINSMFEHGLFMQNLFAVLNVPTSDPMREKGELPLNLKLDFSAGIEFRNVSFRYPTQQTWALRNFNLKVGAGQTIAFVGENGSGKTTLIKLLTRLYEPTEGEIYLFGQPLSYLPKEEFYKHFGVIFQDFVQYQSTVRDNVGFGAVNDMADEKRFSNAVQQGGADELVSSLPEGWETVLGGWFRKGRQLSGGQWQRIALSRAFMRDAQILILDEPTSAMDADKEMAIFSQLKDRAFGKTVFLVSHRFGTVRMADQIIFLKQGVVSESGNHADLMLAQGQYSRLFELQAEGYR